MQLRRYLAWLPQSKATRAKGLHPQAYVLIQLFSADDFASQLLDWPGAEGAALGRSKPRFEGCKGGAKNRHVQLMR